MSRLVITCQECRKRVELLTSTDKNSNGNNCNAFSSIDRNKDEKVPIYVNINEKKSRDILIISFISFISSKVEYFDKCFK